MKSVQFSEECVRLEFFLQHGIQADRIKDSRADAETRAGLTPVQFVGQKVTRFWSVDLF
jgi:hypothetical protein